MAAPHGSGTLYAQLFHLATAGRLISVGRACDSTRTDFLTATTGSQVHASPAASGPARKLPVGRGSPVHRVPSLVERNSPDPNLPKRMRSSPVQYPDGDSAATFADNGGRRVVAYTDNMFENGSNNASKRMKSPPADLRFAPESSISELHRDTGSTNIDRTASPQLSKATYELNQRGSPLKPSFGSGSTSRSLVNYADPLFEAGQIDQALGSKHDSVRHSSKRSNGTKTSSTGVTEFKDQKSHSPGTPISPPTLRLGGTPTRSLSPQGRVYAASKSPPRDLTEREEVAKEKRSARFQIDASKDNSEYLLKKLKESVSHKRKLLGVDHINIHNDVNEEAGADIGVLKSDAIIGRCQDMCPESEIEERERIGDLDKFERLDGDRNQTSRFLAVKKYNRMAEREADLIRPLPVLQQTMDYLLSLLNHPYDENFLYTYNFLWDRMRAIRMDLRMQNIIDQEAIHMLEQMIRLHIVAMHELCEYNKGEGVVEGFDAHLNIEQMNKTSVELFEMYDDHRRMGIIFPSEEEFRGYYALLKLDKHPGYMVETSELSLDLSKMSHDIRRSREVVFARDVARACRAGNFVAFFRLAKMGSYLQACLMHAHFPKLRRQALASLHAGLQNNQGIPVSNVVEWLGMEDEELEKLVEHHGFILRAYEELYMVKEGPFLNNDNDFRLTRSHLVDLKKSQRIVDDVNCAPVTPTKRDILPEREIRMKVVDIGISDEAKECEQINFSRFLEPSEDAALPFVDHANDEMPESCVYSDAEGLIDDSSAVDEKHDNDIASEYPGNNYAEQNLVNSVTSLEQIEHSGPDVSAHINKCEVPDIRIIRTSYSMDSAMVPPERNHLSAEKLIRILRKWKGQAQYRRTVRQRKEALAIAALSSLSLGPPISSMASTGNGAIEQLNIMDAVLERHSREQRSLSKLNVAELAGPLLREKNLRAKCLCWKLLISLMPGGRSFADLASVWLRKKLIGVVKDDDVILSSPEVSIWKSWFPQSLSYSEFCCISIVRISDEQKVDSQSISGTSSLVFQVSESVPWGAQKARFDSILASIPSGAKLPLLIICGDMFTHDHNSASQTIIDSLGLHDSRDEKICSFSVVLIGEGNTSSFFDDDKLRLGMKWLASLSPQQPEVRLVRTYDLYMSNLRQSLELLKTSHPCAVGPDSYVTAFNEALDLAARTILVAASSNPFHWPSPEIELLQELSLDRIFAEMHLPSTGWSLPANIEPLLSAIRKCKLPNFNFDLSWLSRGATSGQQVVEHAMILQECLIHYLADSAQMFNTLQAAKEAEVMVQRGVGLELRDSQYYLTPHWASIFHRIYNWRVSKIAVGKFSTTYLLDENWDQIYAVEPSASGFTEDPKQECLGFDAGNSGMPCPLPDPLSLDEIISGCIPQSTERLSSQQIREHHSVPKSVSATYEMGSPANLPFSAVLFNFVRRPHATSLQPSDILAELRPVDESIDGCGEVQDRIDRMLSFYF